MQPSYASNVIIPTFSTNRCKVHYAWPTSVQIAIRNFRDSCCILSKTNFGPNLRNWLFGLPGRIICEQSPWYQRKWWACSWLDSSPVSPFSVFPEPRMSFEHPCTAYAFFPECLFNHCQGLRRTSSLMCTKFDAVPFSDPSRNRIRPDTPLQIEGCKKSAHLSICVKFCALTPEIR
jgi:hypothetical protein